MDKQCRVFLVESDPVDLAFNYSPAETGDLKDRMKGKRTSRESAGPW